MAATATKNAKPKTKAEPKRPAVEIQSEQDLNDVLAKLSRYQHQREKLNLDLKKKTAELGQKLALKFLVEYDGEKYPIHDIITALESAGIEWAEKHRDELLDGLDKKSKKLPNGVVAWAYKPAKYEIVEGETSKGIIEKLYERFDLKNLFLKLLKKLCLRGKGKDAVTLDRVVTIKAELDLGLVKLHHEKGELADEDLREIGVQLKPREERCTITPNEYTPD